MEFNISLAFSGVMAWEEKELVVDDEVGVDEVE
jgi:hypothetical protein